MNFKINGHFDGWDTSPKVKWYSPITFEQLIMTAEKRQLKGPKNGFKQFLNVKILVLEIS